MGNGEVGDGRIWFRRLATYFCHRAILLLILLYPLLARSSRHLSPRVIRIRYTPWTQCNRHPSKLLECSLRYLINDRTYTTFLEVTPQLHTIMSSDSLLRPRIGSRTTTEDASSKSASSPFQHHLHLRGSTEKAGSVVGYHELRRPILSPLYGNQITMLTLNSMYSEMATVWRISSLFRTFAFYWLVCRENEYLLTGYRYLLWSFHTQHY